MSDAVMTDNATFGRRRPNVSILIPFHKDDPQRLLAALDREAADGFEVIVLDDGSGDPALNGRVASQVLALSKPARLISLTKNEGRSKGRNRLTRSASGDYWLFLDSDMLPDSDDYLGRWSRLIAAMSPMVAFGGFSLDQASTDRRFALHRAMALKSDCLPAQVRGQAPEKNVFTSNLLVHRGVFETEDFDEAFAGWGWEDVEWALRVAKRHPILHVDNPATHLGLDPAPTIAAKYEQSAANFARVVAAHRDVVSGYPSYRAARVLKRAPLRGVWRPMLKAFALAEAAPVKLRAFAMRLYRAALYAEAV